MENFLLLINVTVRSILALFTITPASRTRDFHWLPCRPSYVRESRTVFLFWIPRCWFGITGIGFQYLSVKLIFWILGFQIPWAGFRIPKPRTIPFHKQKIPGPGSTSKHFPDSPTWDEPRREGLSVNRPPFCRLSLSLLELSPLIWGVFYISTVHVSGMTKTRN